MTKTQLVQQEMIQALKNKEMERKQTLTLLLSALKAKAKDKMADLAEDEEIAIIKKEIKQTKETLETCPADRIEIIQQCNFRLSILNEFVPKELEPEEIRCIIQEVLSEAGLSSPTARDKGTIMKLLMPRVKGKADGKLVNDLLGTFFI